MTMLDIRFLVCLQLVRLACSLMDKERRIMGAQSSVALFVPKLRPLEDITEHLYSMVQAYKMEEEEVYIRHQSRNTHVIDTADEEAQHFFKEKTNPKQQRLSY